MNTIYKYQIYDDFYHLTKCHQNELKEMKNLIIDTYQIATCDLYDCSFSDRHFRINKGDHASNGHGTKYLHIHKEIIDSLHFIYSI